MDIQLTRAIKSFQKDCKGSFTLEASLVFPIIFIVTIALILFSLYVYDKVVLYQRAHLIAERLAFTWDNSEKNFETGDFSMNKYTTMEKGDGLYWRSNAIGGEFVAKATGSSIGNELINKKMANGRAKGELLVPGTTIEIKPPASLGANRKVEVTLKRQLNLPKFVDLLVSTEVSITASASVKDPVELIRTTDFIYHYAEEVKNSFGY